MWPKINVFTKWKYSTEQTGILIFDPSDHVSEWFLSPATDSMSDPFWIYTNLVEELASLAESAVKSIRDQVRPSEKDPVRFTHPWERSPESQHQELRSNTKRQWATFIHEVARHATHVTESLDISIQTMERILAHHHDYLKLEHINMSGNDHILQLSEDIHSQLSFLQSCLVSLRCRSTSNEKRLQNEMQRGYNRAAQETADLAQVTADLAQENADLARLDSAAMKKIAYVTLIFLPPTFICALFSMSFFNFSLDSGWSVAKEFWIYWASAIPTTLVIIYLWQYFGETGQQNRLKTEPKPMFLEELV